MKIQVVANMYVHINVEADKRIYVGLAAARTKWIRSVRIRSAEMLEL